MDVVCIKWCVALYTTNVLFAGVSQDHHHGSPASAAIVWLFVDHCCQRYDLIEFAFRFRVVILLKHTNRCRNNKHQLLIFVIHVTHFSLAVSPYVKTLSMVSSTKMLHLLEVSTKWGHISALRYLYVLMTWVYFTSGHTCQTCILCSCDALILEAYTTTTLFFRLSVHPGSSTLVRPIITWSSFYSKSSITSFSTSSMAMLT